MKTVLVCSCSLHTLGKDTMMIGLVLGFALTLGAQTGQAVSPQDEARLNACLEEAERAESCIGVVSDACQEEPGGSTTYGMMQCARRENELWDRRLAAAYDALRADLHEQGHEARLDALHAAQNLWLEFRQAECSQLGLAYEGGTMRGIVHNSCFNDFTARRALDLQSQL